MKQRYKIIRMRRNSRALLEQCAQIVESYRQQGFRISLRQLYYQLVTRNIVLNNEKSYGNLSNLVSNGRLIGELDWEAIEDRGRLPKTPSEFANLKELVEAALYSYRLPRLDGQDHYVELWVEKDALAGVLAPIAHDYHIVLQVNKGYASQSSMWEAACRIDRACRMGKDGDSDYEWGDVTKDAVILYLGDLDPSGEDMVRDIRERLNLFLSGHVQDWDDDNDREDFELEERESPEVGARISYPEEAVQLEVLKIAITPEQVKKYNPPPNPAKLKDSRSARYIAKHGTNSFEVDALPPNILQAIIRGSVEAYLDMDRMQEIKDREEVDKAALRKAVEDIMKGNGK